MTRCLLALPYRDAYFVNNFGFAVRDTQIITEIFRLGLVDDVFIINRPVSIYERLLGIKSNHSSRWPNLDTIDTTSYNPLSPLKGRRWTSRCYTDIFKTSLNKILLTGRYSQIIVADFSPFAILPIVRSTSTKVFYWHDMIDNFLKHNRFSGSDIRSVKEKYEYVRDNYDLLTAQTKAAADAIEHQTTFVFSNGVFGTSLSSNASSVTHDFGFVGFITNKFDVRLINQLRNNGYTVAIYGKSFSSSTSNALRDAGADLFGAFTYAQLPDIMSTFKVGLIPYLADRSHDESPLKMYEYFKNRRPCLTSIDYEIVSKYVINYNTTTDFLSRIPSLLLDSGSQAISECIEPEWYLSKKIERLFDFIPP